MGVKYVTLRVSENGKCCVMGRDWIDAFGGSSTIGSLLASTEMVETEAPETRSKKGRRCPEVFADGGCESTKRRTRNGLGGVPPCCRNIPSSSALHRSGERPKGSGGCEVIAPAERSAWAKPNVVAKRAKQRERKFSIGVRVRVRDYKEEKSWKEGRIVARKGEEAWFVKVGNATWRRRTNQLRHVDGRKASRTNQARSRAMDAESDFAPRAVVSDTEGCGLMLAEARGNVADVGVAAVPGGVPLRRSSRKKSGRGSNLRNSGEVMADASRQ